MFLRYCIVHIALGNYLSNFESINKTRIPNVYLLNGNPDYRNLNFRFYQLKENDDSETVMNHFKTSNPLYFYYKIAEKIIAWHERNNDEILKLNDFEIREIIYSCDEIKLVS